MSGRQDEARATDILWEEKEELLTASDELNVATREQRYGGSPRRGDCYRIAGVKVRNSR